MEMFDEINNCVSCIESTSIALETRVQALEENEHKVTVIDMRIH